MAENNEINTEQNNSAEMETQLAARGEEISRLNGRVSELEKTLSERENAIGLLEKGLKHSVDSYRSLVIQNNPDILPEMITGETIDSLNSSLDRAKELIGKLKTNLESQENIRRVPPGAPQRSGADTGGMSPREKIRWGIGRKG